MMISFVFLLILLGGGAAALGLIVFAIASRKLWIIPVAGGLVFLGLIALGLIGWVVVGSSHRIVHTGAEVAVGNASHLYSQVGEQVPPNFNAYASRPTWFLILMFVVLIAFIVGMILRNGTSPATRHVFRSGWALVPIVLIFGIFFMRSSSRTYTVTTKSNSFDVTPAPRPTKELYEYALHEYVHAMNARLPAAEIEDAKKRFVAELNKRSTGNRRTQQKHVEATMLAQKKRVAEPDIRAEMDQFDAPRIPVSSEMASPKTPKAPEAPSAPSQPDAKTSDKTSSSVQKRKSSGKKPDTIDTTLSQLVAQSKSEQEKNAKKEVAPVSDKAEMIAEAEPDKPKPRPAWVDESPKRTGNTRREVIATDLYESIDECYQAADIYLLLKTYQRLQQLAGRPYIDDRLPSLTFRNGQISADGQIISYGRGNPYWADDRLRMLTRMGVGIDYVRREIVAKDPKNNESREYVETVERSFGPMKKLYLQIEFTSSVDRELLRHWDAYHRQERFAIAGISAGSVVGFLALIFGLLKIDTWTKGYYTKLLFLGLPAAIIVSGLLLTLALA